MDSLGTSEWVSTLRCWRPNIRTESDAPVVSEGSLMARTPPIHWRRKAWRSTPIWPCRRLARVSGSHAGRFRFAGLGLYCVLSQLPLCYPLSVSSVDSHVENKIIGQRTDGDGDQYFKFVRVDLAAWVLTWRRSVIAVVHPTVSVLNHLHREFVCSSLRRRSIRARWCAGKPARQPCPRFLPWPATHHSS